MNRQAEQILADVQNFAKWRGGKLAHSDYEIYKRRIQLLNLGAEETAVLRKLAEVMGL